MLVLSHEFSHLSVSKRATPPTTTSSHLPPELIDLILSFIPAKDLTRTTLCLLYADPRSQLSRSNLWKHLQIARLGQAEEIIASRRWRGEENRIANTATRSLEFKCWLGKSRSTVALIESFERLSRLKLNVGPVFQPDDLEDLFANSNWIDSVQSISLRFNPYVILPTYNNFLKGIYFDSTLTAISSWSNLNRNVKSLSLIQDLQPMYLKVIRDTPAWGLPRGGDGSENYVPPKRRLEHVQDPMDFAQPIIFFQLLNLSYLALSPVGSSITSLTLRLPRRDLLPPLTTFPYVPLSPPFPQLRHLDLSTTHMISDLRLPLLLRLYQLEHLVLDRCTGLMRENEMGEESGWETLRWIGKTVGSSTRGDDFVRKWKKLVKSRPSGVVETVEGMLSSATTGKKGSTVTTKKTVFDSMLPASALIKDLILVPSLPTLLSLGIGLFDLPVDLVDVWEHYLRLGYDTARSKLKGRIEEGIKRFELQRRKGKDEIRIVAFRDSLNGISEDEENGDEAVIRFCRENDLVMISSSTAHRLLTDHHSFDTLTPLIFCTTPDLSNEPGRPHLSSLSTLSQFAVDDSVEVIEKREKTIAIAEEEDERKWRRSEGEHVRGCGHLKRREFE